MTALDAPRVRPRGVRVGLVICGVLLALAPWPIFLDLDTWSVIWRTPRDSFLALPAGAIPMPIGALGFALFCLLNLFRIRGLSIPTEGIRLPSPLVWPIILSVCALWILNTAAGGSLTKFVQLYVVLLAVFALRLPTRPDDMHTLLRWVYVSFFLFLPLHVWSVFTSELLQENPVYAYGTLLTGSVHGSLVAYPAVVFLYGIVLLIRSLTARRPVLLLLLALVPVLFALYAERRETALQVLLLGAGGIGTGTWLLLSRHNDRLLWQLLRTAAFTVPPVLLMAQAGYVSSFGRLLLGESDPRVEIWATVIPESVTDLLFGSLQAANNAHSYGFSVLMSFGVFGLLPILLLGIGVVMFVTGAGRQRRSLAPTDRRLVLMRRLILWVFGVSLVSSNVFNTNITQPYYVVNVIVLFMLLRTPDTGLVPPSEPSR